MKLKKFEQFIKENNNGIESTTSVMSFDETEQFLINKLKENPKYFDNVVYRGVKINKDYIKVDYKDFDRQSAYSGANYLNLILSNDERFSEFQKRNKSIICTTSLEYSRFFKSAHGNIFMVLPIENNAVFTYVDGEDLFDIIDPSSRNRDITNICNYFNIPIDQTNYNNFISNIKEFDKKCESGLKNAFIYRSEMISDIRTSSIYKDIKNKNYNNMSEFIDLIFKLNDIHIKFHNINFLDIHTLNKGCEIWTESPCILLNIESELAKKYNLIK